MTAHSTIPHVPLAHAGPITDDILAKAIGQADQITAGETPADGGHLLLFVLAPALRELLKRRRAMGVIADMADLDNVVLLEPGAT